ncbi:Polyadenylate-binding protein, cytoplasmic and nuclear [Wickerhamiella sorbophila]|uniref:Polyadenylate-binding protein, cytoplasmic and nuclear n=1 Tax=Wickerhamiella sorbophila TaxID=45607 RepID=A0A2T0FIC3_9ASCO|nr:Polyadenylate-binding protein, cytoplasmic and nuclear [Wickerhamiella sorbophila]PRT54740.1 Polyadenylate-binding protein, cytoplasmic and nuclear [Wickerhamiella sorbophila]
MSVSTDSIASPDRAGNKNTLCVCDLDALVSEAHLQAAFTGGSHSPPVSAMVIRDQLTHRSLGYGIVLFRSESDAVAAKDAAQPLFVGPNLCRVIGPYKDGTLTRPPPRPTGEGIFIKNLAPDVVAPELYQEFAPYGEILACRIVLSDYGQSRGMAYVTYSSKEAALKAIDAVNGETLHNRKLYVGPNLPRHERLHRYDDSKEEFTNIFVTGVASSVPEHDFYESFAKIGAVDAYSMPLDQFGQPRGFGFVNYKHHKDAVRAIEELDGKLVIGGRTLGVTRAQQKPSADQNSSNNAHANQHPGSDSHPQPSSAGSSKDDAAASCNLYIRHIDRIVTDSVLESAFADYGPVVSAKIMRDERGGSRGYGFVCFENPESAQAAIKGMNGTVVWGQALYVALAQRRDRGPRRMRGPYNNVPFTMGVPSVMPMVPSPYYYWGVGVHGAPVAIPAPAMVPGQDGNTMASLQTSMAQMQLAQPKTGSPSTMTSKETSDDGNLSRSSNNWNRSSQQSQSQHRAWSPNMSRKTRRQRDFQPSLAAAVASAENEAAEKQVVGEALYPKVLKHPAVDSPELASRLTGILLKQKTSEVLEWVDNDFLLAKIVYQALDALREFEATAPDS